VVSTVILEVINWSIGVLRMHSVQKKVMLHRLRVRLMGNIQKEG
jgi:hypothetical protein